MDGLILLNKDKDMTSHDLVNIVRRQINQKRVGHTGTLDPNATGLMIVAVGKSTKLVPYLQTDTKEYILKMKLGVLTDTLDIWGKVLETEEFVKPSKEKLINVLNTFLGKQMQKPPMYSAIKINGQKLYNLARAGKTIEVPSRQVEIHEIELLNYNETIEVRVVCSAGTYIRTLCLDIASKIGTTGTMTSLIRTKIGDFSLEESYTVKELRNNEFKLLEPQKALSKYPIVEYEDMADIENGRKIMIETKHDLVLVKVENKLMAFYSRIEGNLFRSKRGLW